MKDSSPQAGRVALVTGGSRGIGRAVVLALAQAGYHIATTYANNESAMREVLPMLERQGVEHLCEQCDIGDPAQVARLAQSVEARFGRVDLLVNNAGITRDGLLATMSYDDLEAVVRTNLLGPLLCIQAILPAMLRQRGGCIVNIGSVAASKPGKGQSNYAAAKGGLEAASRALAVELASRNVRVNVVAPGVVATDMSQALLHGQGADLMDRLLIKRPATVEEVADAVVFLADRATYMTGEVVHVNGGLKMS